PSGVTLQPDSASNSVLALAATGQLVVAGKIDWSGFGVSLGGSPGMPGNDSLQGVGGGGAAATVDGAGGGGGGYHDAGNSGMPAAGGGAGGSTYGSNDLMPVYTGSGGGGATKGAQGGNSGGAVALFATDLVISGSIDVHGLAGKDATMNGGGGGGG